MKLTLIAASTIYTRCHRLLIEKPICITSYAGTYNRVTKKWRQMRTQKPKGWDGMYLFIFFYAIASNGPVYTQLRCCAEKGQPQLPRHMARILPDSQLLMVTTLKLKDL